MAALLIAETAPRAGARHPTPAPSASAEVTVREARRRANNATTHHSLSPPSHNTHLNLHRAPRIDITAHCLRKQPLYEAAPNVARDTTSHLTGMSDNPSSSRRPLLPPQRPSEADDVTWLDFLRTAGGTVPADNNTSSTERKRRHAGSSPERRGYPYTAYAPNTAMTGRRPSGMNMAGVPGSSRENAIDLTSPPRRPPQERTQMPQPASRTFEEMMASRPRPRYSGAGGSVRGNLMPPRRESDIVLPSWQPDSEVSRCPVCQTDFHFFYRKHHCRKCGRVVCAACSPHRITIPKQYIVQPPTSSDGEQAPLSPVSRPTLNMNLGGGEVVRVCNPCVPDPWTPESASDGSHRPQQDNARLEGSEGRNVIPDRYRHPQEAAARVRSHSHQPQQSPFGNAALFTTGFGQREPYSRPPHTHRSTQSSANASFPVMPPGQMPLPVPPPPPPQTRPRREVREEDECPVCGTEMPPGENVREAHIQECITLRFSSTPSSSSLPTHPPSAPPPRTSSIQSALPSATPAVGAPAPPSGPFPPPGSRPRATSYRPRGMAIYRATEKDCMTEDGEPQECVICFEEFQPGDEMGRMECLCKFHRLCIRRWWDTKGTGSCPTHQLHD